MTPASLSVIVVSWNTRSLLRDCLGSLARSTVSLMVTVVDNASSDGSADMVREEFPNVHLIANAGNVGFARACNQALGDMATPFGLLLNPDAVPVGECLERLLSFLRDSPERGVVAPKVVHPNGRLRVLSAGRQPSPRSLFNHYFGVSRLSGAHRSLEGLNLIRGIHDDRPRRVEWVSGACVMFRREVLESVGPLSERWFMYGEDMDWSARIGRAGWELWHVPAAVVRHQLGAGSEQNAALSSAWLAAMRGHYETLACPSRARRALFDSILIGGLTSRAVTYAGLALVRRRESTMWRSEARAYARHVRAYAHLVRGGAGDRG